MLATFATCGLCSDVKIIIKPHCGEQYEGKGIVIGRNTVLTCFHNIEYPKYSGRYPQGLKVYAARPKSDLAVIAYPTGTIVPTMLAFRAPQTGDTVRVDGIHGKYIGKIVPLDAERYGIVFDNKKPRQGDSGSPCYNQDGLIGMFHGFRGDLGLILKHELLVNFGIPKFPPRETEQCPVPDTGIDPVPDTGIDPVPDPISLDSQLESIFKEEKKSPQDRHRGQESHKATPDSDTKSSVKSKILDFAWSKAIKDYAIPWLLGALGVGTGGIAGWGVWLGLKAIPKVFNYFKRKKTDPIKERDSPPDTSISGPKTLQQELEEVLGRRTAASGFPHIQGREVSEVNELLQLAQLEGYDPLMGAAYGLFMQDEITKLLKSENPEQVTLIRDLVDKVKDRINQAAPIARL